MFTFYITYCAITMIFTRLGLQKAIKCRFQARSLATDVFKSRMDPIQEGLLKEKCYLIDENDNVIGSASKKDCHLIPPNGELKLHRAFSVFIFNTKGELLVQRRAASKITYPNTYTNTCCSHPLADFPDEKEEKDGLGVKIAAQRRLNYELGVPEGEIPLDQFKYLTRFHYIDRGDGVFGEHEIDYILFVQKDVRFLANENEVSELKYIKKDELDPFIKKNYHQLTPWFRLLHQHGILQEWWNNLYSLDKCVNHDHIMRLKFKDQI